MLLRLSKAGLILLLPLLSMAADDSRPACTSRIQGRMWPDAANHDPKLISSLTRCGELLICVRGTWHYHWEAPSVRVDQLGRHSKSRESKPADCEVEAAVDAHPPDASAKPGRE